MKFPRIFLVITTTLSLSLSVRADRQEFQQTASLTDQMLLAPFMLPYSGLFLTLNALFLARQAVGSGLSVQQEASKTAEGVALIRSMLFDMGLCNDSMAHHFIPWSHQAVRYLNYPYFWYWGHVGDFGLGIGAVAVRSDLGDEIFIEFTRKAQQSQEKRFAVVQLGAGYDTRFFRLREQIPTNVEVFELDIATTQSLKKRKLSENEIDHAHVMFVPIDFSREDVAEKLTNSGRWSNETPTLFLWEGVSMYISEDHANNVMEFVGHSAPGSELYIDILTDFFSPNAMAKPSWAGWLNQKIVENNGEKFQFGLKQETDTEINKWLARWNMTAEKIIRQTDMESRFFRRPDGSLSAGCVDCVTNSQKFGQFSTTRVPFPDCTC